MSTRNHLFPVAIAVLAMTTLLAPAPPASAQATATPAEATQVANVLPKVNAEVRRVDAANGKVTLKHGDIPNLDMPPMTMVFQVRDPAQLAPLKAGDKVRFTADKVNGAYTVIDLQPAP